MLVQNHRNTHAALSSLLRKCLRTKPSIRKWSSRTNWPCIGLHFGNFAAAIVIDQGGCSRTIEPKIPIWLFDDGRENNRSSSRNPQPRGSSPPTPQSTTPLTADRHLAFSWPKLIGLGPRPPPLREWSGLGWIIACPASYLVGSRSDLSAGVCMKGKY